MTNRTIILFLSDIKYILRVPFLLAAVLSPFLIAIILLLISPLITGRFYTLTTITFIAVIPILSGLVVSKTHFAAVPSQKAREAKSDMMARITLSALTGFAVLVPVIFLTDAVPDEGWLRGLYASVLFAVVSPLVLILSACLAGNSKLRRILLLLTAALIITVPVGLLLHHPWNYFAFFSPLYWAVWAWVIATPSESLMYGIISLAISAVSIFFLYRYYCRRVVIL